MEIISPAEPLLLDNSKRSCWKTCKRKFFYLYVKRIKPNTQSNALRYGQTWHSGLEAFYLHIKDNGWTKDGSALHAAVNAMRETWDIESSRGYYYNDYRTLENCIKAFLQYVNVFTSDEGMMDIVDGEKEFRVAMKTSSGMDYFFTGKIDLVVDLNHRRWIFEHKTTGQSLDMQVNRLHRSAQVMGYYYTSTLIYPDNPPEGALITIHHLGAYKSKKTDTYGEPKIDFRRSPQIFSKNDIDQWKLAFDDVAEEVAKAQTTGSYPMCHDSCFQFGACPYLQICEQQSEFDELRLSDQFYIDPVEWNPGKDTEAIS